MTSQNLKDQEKSMDMNAMRNWRWMILLMHSNSFRVHRKIEILKRSNQQGKEKKRSAVLAMIIGPLKISVIQTL